METNQSLSGLILITKSNKGFVCEPAENKIDIQKTIFIYDESDQIDKNSDSNCFSEFHAIIFVNFNFGQVEGLKTFIQIKSHNPNCQFYLKNDQNCDYHFESLYALDFGFDGILVAEPVYAGDTFQKKLELKINQNREIKKSSVSVQIDLIRTKMETIDCQIIQLIGCRMRLSEEMAALKHETNQPFLQSERWDTVLQKSIDNGKKHGISENLILDIFNAIHIGSLKAQMDWLRIMDNKKKYVVCPGGQINCNSIMI